jgi:hypothetical protein
MIRVVTELVILDEEKAALTTLGSPITLRPLGKSHRRETGTSVIAVYKGREGYWTRYCVYIEGPYLLKKEVCIALGRTPDISLKNLPKGMTLGDYYDINTANGFGHCFSTELTDPHGEWANELIEQLLDINNYSEANSKQLPTRCF